MHIHVPYAQENHLTKYCSSRVSALELNFLGSINQTVCGHRYNH